MIDGVGSGRAFCPISVSEDWVDIWEGIFYACTDCGFNPSVTPFIA